MKRRSTFSRFHKKQQSEVKTLNDKINMMLVVIRYSTSYCHCLFCHTHTPKNLFDTEKEPWLKPLCRMNAKAKQKNTAYSDASLYFGILKTKLAIWILWKPFRAFFSRSVTSAKRNHQTPSGKGKKHIQVIVALRLELVW